MRPSLFCVVTLLLAASLSAQDTRGKVQGTVSDSSGAVVPAAAVTLLNTDTNVRANSTTNQNGHYLFDFVIPGNYQVMVEITGFRPFIQKNILVEALSDVTVNTALQIGTARDAVTVEESPVSVEFNSSTLSNTVDTKMANTLPLVSRNQHFLEVKGLTLVSW